MAAAAGFLPATARSTDARRPGARSGAHLCSGALRCPGSRRLRGGSVCGECRHFVKICGNLAHALAFGGGLMYNIIRAVKHADVAQSVERILGKDEVTGSNPVISSRNQSEMAGFFVVWGWVLQEWARHPAFLLTSILPGRILSVFPSVFSPFDPFKSPVPQAFSAFSKISFPVSFQPVDRGDGKGGVGMLLPAFYIMLQGHCRRGMSCRRLCLLDVFGRIV